MRILSYGLIGALLAAGSAHAEPAPKLTDIDLLGSVGAYGVGMNLQMRNNTEVIGAYYFYTSKLKDIRLSPSNGADADQLVLTEPGGGAFHLHFVGNGSEHGAPLTAYNSVGLAGSWTQGARTLPVKLQMESAEAHIDPGHRYALITNEPDVVFETRVRQFLDGVVKGNRLEAAAAISYPLRVDGAKPTMIRSKAQLLAHWSDIFTPGYVAVLKTSVPHDMFVNDRGAMIADGAVWFDDKGASRLNVLFGAAKPKPPEPGAPTPAGRPQTRAGRTPPP